jgi:two-component sensor histidine kinase
MPASIEGIADAQALAQAIVDTIHEPLLVLDARLCVLAASRSFYRTFHVDPDHTVGNLLYDLGDGQWNIPALRLLLETIIPEHVAMDGFEVDHDFPSLGRRIMLLNARKVFYDTSVDTTILLAFTDITARRAIELEKDQLLATTKELLGQQKILLQEMQHRVANSLQIIASILTLKARRVSSEETRHHLHDARQRVMSVAQVQSHLNVTGRFDQVEVRTYLTNLCASLGRSMISDSQPIAISVAADDSVVGSDKAVSIGLVIAELVINAVKYAFPSHRTDAAVTVFYESIGEGWRLTVSDNGVGKDADALPPTEGGLGTFLVQALIKQLGAEMTMITSPGMTISIHQARPVAIG